MQGLKSVFVVATIVVTAAALSACGWHHKQVTHKPLKLGSVVEQPVK